MATVGFADLKQTQLPALWDAATMAKVRLADGSSFAEMLGDVRAGLVAVNRELLNMSHYGGMFAVQDPQTPQVEYPYIRNVYKLYGAADKVENAHFPDENHDYGYSKRMPMYKFMGKHLALSLGKVSRPDGSIDESFVTIEKQEDMYAFDEEHARPKNAVQPDAKELPWD